MGELSSAYIRNEKDKMKRFFDFTFEISLPISPRDRIHELFIASAAAIKLSEKPFIPRGNYDYRCLSLPLRFPDVRMGEKSFGVGNQAPLAQNNRYLLFPSRNGNFEPVKKLVQRIREVCRNLCFILQDPSFLGDKGGKFVIDSP